MDKFTRKATKEVEKWNKKCYPIGQKVSVKLDSGEIKETTTTSDAEVMGSTAVIWLEGIRGAYMLSRVTAIN